MFIRVVLTFITMIFFGCQNYTAKPILPKRSLQAVEKSRNLLTNSSLETPDKSVDRSNWHFTFLTAVQLLAKNNPSLKGVHSEYKKAYQLAQLKTPLPNPELEIGSLIGSQLGDAGDEKRIQPLVSFGFTIPLSSRLSKEDEVYSTMTKYAYLKYLLQHRSEYIKLRKLYIELILLEEQKTIHAQIIESVKTALTITTKLIEVGVATALDIGIMELELLQKQSQLTKIDGQITAVKGKLSQILGVNSKVFVLPQHVSCPELPKNLPPLIELKEIMLENHPDLALLRAAYDISEKELSLEITKQTPDITISPSFEGDPGDDKKIWGISVRFPIPIFDQNERAIASRKNNREIIKIQYEGALNNGLALLETSYQHYLQQRQRSTEINDKTLKKAQDNVAIALETLKRGELDFLKYVDSERSLRNILLEVHEAKTAMYKAWLNMEQIMGMPIWFLPQEKRQTIPSLNKKPAPHK